MSKTIKIARRELFSIFVSPVAWVLILLYVAYFSYFYFEVLSAVAKSQIFYGELVRSLTFFIFTHPSAGIFTRLEPALILFVPLLTMGVISKERQNGSLKLLLSTPISTFQIVLGKFLAVSLYLLLLMALLSALAVFSGMIIEHFEYSRALAGLMGLYLVANVYAAIGIFISSFTDRQMVSAIATMAFLGLLRVIGEAGQTVPVIADVAFWLSIDGRFAYFRSGLVTSKDVIYCLLLIVMFLAFTQIVLMSGRVRASKLTQFAKSMGVLVIVATVGYVTSLHTFTINWDLTRRGEVTLSEGSKAALAGLDERVEMLAVVNALDLSSWQHNPSRRAKAHRRIFEIFEREIGPIGVDYQYYYAEPGMGGTVDEADKAPEERARSVAEGIGLNFQRFMSEDEAEASFQVSSENYGTFYVLRYGNETARLRTFQDTYHYPEEDQISAALRSLIDAPAHVAYAIGNNERSAFQRRPADHRLITLDHGGRNALINHGFEFSELSLLAPVPASVDILVLAAPTLELSEPAVLNLQRYIATGKNLLVMGEPGTETVLNRALSDVTGVRFAGPVAGSAGDGFPEDMVFPAPDEAAGRFGYGRSFQDLRAFDNPLVMSGAVSLEVLRDTDFTVTPLVSVRYESAEPDPAVLGVTLERQIFGRAQRIALIGDADFMSASTLRLVTPQYTENAAFTRDLFYFLSGDVYPVDTSRPAPIDVKSSLSFRQVDRVGFVLLGVIPLFLIVTGAGVLLARRRA